MKFIFLLIFIITNCLAYDEFIISYKAIVKNHVLIGEEFYISKPVKKTKDYKVIGECSLDILDSNIKNENTNIDSNLRKILKENKDSILECISSITNILIRDDLRFINNAIFSKTTFKLPPQRILMDDDKTSIKIIREKP